MIAELNEVWIRFEAGLNPKTCSEVTVHSHCTTVPPLWNLSFSNFQQFCIYREYRQLVLTQGWLIVLCSCVCVYVVQGLTVCFTYREVSTRGQKTKNVLCFAAEGIQNRINTTYCSWTLPPSPPPKLTAYQNFLNAFCDCYNAILEQIHMCNQIKGLC